VTGNARLVIEYALLAALVVVGVIAMTAKMHGLVLDKQISEMQSKVDTQQGKISDLVDANHQQQQAIGQLQDMRDKDSHTIVGLQGDLKMFRVSAKSVSDKVSELEKNNARAKALMDVAVAPDIGCVLDGTPCPAAARSTNQSH
jgi:Flp pilus assembly pilin Flp